MATKSQLKTYFETGNIPTQAQFAELIDSFINIPSLNTEDRGNQNLFFGNGEQNPHIRGVRTATKIVSTNVITMFIFSAHNNNNNASSFPLFILNRTSTRAASLNDAQATLRYCIPNKLNIDNFVMHGLDCDNSTDGEIIAEVSNWEFKPFEKEDGDDFYILNVLTNISGAFSTFKFDLAKVNIGGTAKTLPVRLIGIINNDTGLTVTGIYNIKDGVNWEEFKNTWYSLTKLLKVTNGTVTSTNAMVVTHINTIKNNYMVKQ